ncbi:MAG: hypothetical protein HC918_08700 [Oscillatoriales cyanobacterium SM2_1_8]|nr:hypothetical protein [Oscillatoriales cyanobacterium SM2_1_8]
MLAPSNAEQKQLQKSLQEHRNALARLEELARSVARKEQQAVALAAEMAAADPALRRRIAMPPSKPPSNACNRCTKNG